MKNVKLNKILINGFVTLLLIFFTSTIVLAQSGGPGVDLGDNPDNGVPLEGADFLLLAMAGGYVIIKLWQYKQKKKSEEEKFNK